MKNCWLLGYENENGETVKIRLVWATSYDDAKRFYLKWLKGFNIVEVAMWAIKDLTLEA